MQNISSYILAIVVLIFLFEGVRSQYDLYEDFSVGGIRSNEAPEVILSEGDPDPINIYLGGNLYSRCSISNMDEDSYTIRWIRRLSDRTVEELSPDARLLLQNVDYEQLQYPILCQAIRESDNFVIEKEIALRIMTQTDLRIVPMSATPIWGQEFGMQCQPVPPPDFPVNYVWHHQGREVHRGETLRLPMNSIDNEGSYTCTMEYQDSFRGRQSLDAMHNVSFRYTTGSTLDLTVGRDNIMVVVPGESRELHCELERPSSSVQWFFNDQPIEYNRELNATGSVFRQDTLRLSNIIIKNIEPRHQGKYECHYDSTIKSAMLIVRAVFLGIEVNPKQYRVNEGETVEFHCRVETGMDNGNRLYQWYFRPRNDERRIPLDFQTTGFQRRDDPIATRTSFISKSAVTCADDGFYVCILPTTNSEAEGELIVLGSAPRPRLHLTVTPRIIRVCEYKPIQLECYATDECTGQPYNVQLNFKIHGRSFSFDSNMISSSRAQFRVPSGLSPEYNGTEVECYTDIGGMDRAIVVIECGSCPPGFRRCHSGDCIPSGQFCDGNYDCRDRSDEDAQYCNSCIPISKKCEYYNGQTPSQTTYMVHWECDGEDDCGNGYDERRCPVPMFADCDGHTFACSSSSRRIPMAFACDKEQDCPYGEDERSCSPPVVETNQVSRYPTRQGDTLTLQCRVTGFPLPRVIWRFNWGCLPSESRFVVTSQAINCGQQIQTVLSTLTINGVRPGDDAIYNCEGLFGVHRAMSNDYHVVIENYW